ncbi:OST-HTH/LOTUS domain-containing protein [uncultured Aggregatibacter sp.]|uniref:OST-HTH/LOTUS domain-containing protein n=1 Tax=uncultured Aggregatibacter sp. TaxID=470564 RepID=UPI0025E060D8|nr:OST-HTH/LOTUS domain-containing protein [uncultured Aggregatibacter sp.]
MLGQKWGLLETDFDPRNYGCKKLRDLIKKYNDIFELKISGKRNFLVRLKKLISYCKEW